MLDGYSCEISHRLERGIAFFIRMWKPHPSTRVLKTLRGSPKGKTQRGQYLLAVGLSRVDCEIPHKLESGASARVPHVGWGGEQNTLYKGVETFL